MDELEHAYDFDPSYGYDLDALLSVDPPEPPPGFAEFWQQRYRRALDVDPSPALRTGAFRDLQFQVYNLSYTSTDDVRLHGWLLRPQGRPPTRAIVVGHGYGGIETPDFELPLEDAIYCVPCLRGLGCSAGPPYSSEPHWHVLHDIHLRDRYVLGGCVDDIWTAVSAVRRLFPETEERIGYMGISFGGGLGALAMATDLRIRRGHFNVPTFGHQPLRLTLPTVGSGAAVQAFERRHGHTLETLLYYDAAVAARSISRPVHVAAALFDPAVAPPGQFAVYNALPGERQLYVLRAGHFDYPGRLREERELLTELGTFFEPL